MVRKAAHKAWWFWFESGPLNLGARIVRVQEGCGSLMLDDYETNLYHAVDAFDGRAMVR